MTILAMEGFEHGDITHFDYSSSINDGNISTSYGRHGGKGIAFSSGDTFYMYLPDGTTAIYCGFAFKPTNMFSGSNSSASNYMSVLVYSDYALFAGMQALTTPGLCQWSLRISDVWQWVDGQFQFSEDRWYYIEFYLNMNDTTGAFTWKVNGQTIASETGIDTLYGTSTKMTYIDFNDGSFYGYVDDIYVTDDGFLGDVRIRGFVPDSNGSTNDFTASAGSNYECIDETPSTDDTDYVSADTGGDIDLYTITTGALATVHGVKVSNLVRKDDAGTREIRNICRSNGSNYNGDTEQISDSYAPVKYIWETDPDDSNAWTQTKLEAAEFGLEIVT